PAVLQIGPCCRLGTHTIVVAVVSPDVSSMSITGVDGPNITWGTMGVGTATNPVDPDGWRYVVLDAPVQSGDVRVDVHRTDGRVVTEPDRLNLDVIGG
ncbi:MAG: hypothetical protein JWO68_2381, partial [Actinomycetia bacterium]|nr:hypothetical protein [Actinomycetes bacterium]